MEDYTVIGFLVDGESLFNVIYIDTLEQLGLHQLDLSPHGDRGLIAFIYFVTHPCGMTDLPISLREEDSERKVTLYFLVVQCRKFSTASLTKNFFGKIECRGFLSPPLK